MNCYTITTICSDTWIQIKDTITKFFQIISDAMEGEIMFHLSDPTRGIRAIKFVHLNSMKTQFVMKVIGMKGVEMGRFDVFMVGRLLK